MYDPDDSVVGVDAHEFKLGFHHTHGRRDVIAVFVPEQQALVPYVLVSEVRSAVRNDGLDFTGFGILRD